MSVPSGQNCYYKPRNTIRAKVIPFIACLARELVRLIGLFQAVRMASLGSVAPPLLSTRGFGQCIDCQPLVAVMANPNLSRAADAAPFAYEACASEQVPLHGHQVNAAPCLLL